MYATLVARNEALNIASSSCGNPAMLPRMTAPMKRGRFCYCQSDGYVKKGRLKSHLHPVGVTGLHTFVLGVGLSRQAILELGFHVVGARASVVPVEEIAPSSDTHGESMRQERD